MPEKNPQKPDKALIIHTKLNEDFYLSFLRCIKSVHKLTEGQMKVLAAFLYQRFLLSKDISNPKILDQVVLGKDVRKVIRESFNMTTTHFQVIMSKFKERGIIENNTINPKVIPHVTEDSDLFKLSIYFQFDEKEQNI